MRTEFLDVPASVADDFKKMGNKRSVYKFAHVATQRRNFSRAKKAQLRSSQVFTRCSNLWASLSDTEKANWTAAGAEMGLSGWQLFLKDTGYRLTHGLPGLATPSTLHQTMAGHLHLAGDGGWFTLEQHHPNFYNLYQKVEGTKALFKKIRVQDILSWPVHFELSYKSNLNYFYGLGYGVISFEVFFRGIGGADDRYKSWGIDENTDWKQISEDLDFGVGRIYDYMVQIQFWCVEGDIWFDNLKISFGGHDYAIDPYFENVEGKFARAEAFNIRKPWIHWEQPAGYYSWFWRSEYAG